MTYIILDLEWNQPISYQSRTYREIGDKLIFEMIQIGAVKLDAELNLDRPKEQPPKDKKPPEPER